ncbi:MULTISPECIES: BofC C-terminal domain-containing protein [unclassified Paenibacillus]|uniref:BofC C-terminal domain-containing protein n=1 Tax=unclassified Paenibacillus TaxID=185978 RepID=UPI000CFD856E|nr:MULTISPECIES: BofC C-terminal domain-containing protein [unclassified Paenibacillus]PRA00787.1 regulator [Paenibacillus sp. MYb63]PRA49677.1 regulator [Paenibacillus sp. MYb67]
MNTFNFRKQFKRRWRRWKRTVWMTVALLAVTILAYSGLSISSAIERLLTTNFSEATSVMGPVTQETRSEQEIQALVEQLDSDPDHLTSVVLETQYICGVETEQLGKMARPQLKMLLAQHPEWDATVGTSDELHLKQRVDDLSSLCKQQAYISIDAVGNLNLYEGKPAKEKVIRTFFQLDVGTLESSLPEGVLDQLQQGIRIQDKDEYDSVISTFSDYAVDEDHHLIRNGG